MKISFCTSIRNRLHHLKETLKENLHHCNFQDAEFVILDYGSTDGLRNYLLANYDQEIKLGKIKHYEYRDSENFDRCHARNLAFKIATGDILCNLDADNYVGAGFFEFIKKTFQEDKECFITGIDNIYNLPDCWGRLCVRKEDFNSVGGYDEEFEGHGYEDVDIINRLGFLGLRKVVIQEPNFLKAIAHDDNQRIKEEKLTSSLEKILMYPKNDRENLFVLLFKNRQYLACTVLRSNPEEFAVLNNWNQFRLSTGENEIHVGQWLYNNDILTLNNTRTVSNYQIMTMNGRNVYISDKGSFYEILKSENYCNLVLSIMQIFNRYRMEDNLAAGRLRPRLGFGIGKLYNSHQIEQSIQLQIN